MSDNINEALRAAKAWAAQYALADSLVKAIELLANKESVASEAEARTIAAKKELATISEQVSAAEADLAAIESEQRRQKSQLEGTAVAAKTNLERELQGIADRARAALTAEKATLTGEITDLQKRKSALTQEVNELAGKLSGLQSSYNALMEKVNG